MYVNFGCYSYPYFIGRNQLGGQKEDKNLEGKYFIINFVKGNGAVDVP